MGFDRAEYLDTLKTVTGQERDTVLPTQRAHFGVDVDAVELVHEIAKEQELEDLFKGMHSGGHVLSGGRQRRNGRNEFSDIELLNDRYSAIDDILIQNSMNTLAELQVLYDRRDQLNSNFQDWRLEYLSAEENARIDALPEEDQWDATKELMDEKLAAGEISAEEHAEFIRQYEAYQENEANIAKKEEHLLSQDENLSRDENAAVIAHQLSLKRQQLTERRAEIDTRLGENLILIDRLNTLRTRGGSREDVVDLIEDRPDLDVDIPESASGEQSISIVEQAVTTDSATLEVERVDTETELDDVTAAQTTLSRAGHQEQILEAAAAQGVEADVDEENFLENATGLTGGFQLALGANEPLDAPKETPVNPSNDGAQQETYTADLGLKTDLTG